MTRSLPFLFSKTCSVLTPLQPSRLYMNVIFQFHIVSGDDDGVVRSVATFLNISDSNSRSYRDPAGKQAYAQDLLSQTRAGDKSKRPNVMFCATGPTMQSL